MSIKIKDTLLIICVCCILLAVIIPPLYNLGFFVTDCSAEFNGNVLHWNGETYITTAGDYKSGKPIAKTEDGLVIYLAEGYPDGEVLVIGGFLENYIVERQD